MTKAEQKALENMQTIEINLIRKVLKRQVVAFERLVKNFKTDDIREKTFR
jgi:hypothetical protein